MKQFTTPEMTAKLVELGYPAPKSAIKAEREGNGYWYNPAYSIGELIEILPKIIEYEIWFGDEKGQIGVWGLSIDTGGTDYGFDVSYERHNSVSLCREGRSELIDALYDMCVFLRDQQNR